MNEPISGSIMLVGVGGQGVLTAAEIIAQACLLEGYDVKKSEVHGMAQRGGSVVSHVRYARNGSVHSPLPARGRVDLLVGFELIEAVRALSWVVPQGKMVLNDLLLPPPSADRAEVPSKQDCLASANEHTQTVVVVEGEELAQQVGNIRTINTAVVGAAAALLPISVDSWQQAIEQSVPAGTAEVNWQAFGLGYAKASNV